MTTDTREVIAYHEQRARYFQMSRRQSWGRSRDFKQMLRDSEQFHHRAAKALRRNEGSGTSGSK
jgi:bisphosphoglycerate-independent phosphoglycerate mutase (AlkP superfamily)